MSRRLPAGVLHQRPPPWYQLAWLLALPLAMIYLLWRSLRQPDYRRHWGQRFVGLGPALPPGLAGPRFWIHAVSVGETRAAQPLIALLAQRHPQAGFILTHMTPTGRAAAADLAQRLGPRLVQRYLPYDRAPAIARFLAQTQPTVGVLMETEIWPNLLYAAARRGLPMVLANARLSERSLAKAQRHAALLRAAAACLSGVGAQSVGDGARLQQLYAGSIVVTGNGKFDCTPDAGQIAAAASLRTRLFTALGARPIWLFASTRAGEEALILSALPKALAAAGGAGGTAAAPLLLFVPRHPQRFDAVASLLQAHGWPVVRRAQWRQWAHAAPPEPSLQPVQSVQAAPEGRSAHSAAGADRALVLLGDSMGEMALYYALADIAVMGGSLLPLGGQNLIEACACGCPVILGPHTYNFAAVAADALAAGAALRAADVHAALDLLARLSADRPGLDAMARAGRDFARVHRGATARTAQLIEGCLQLPAAAG